MVADPVRSKEYFTGKYGAAQYVCWDDSLLLSCLSLCSLLHDS
jgi:hypothetical protein